MTRKIRPANFFVIIALSIPTLLIAAEKPLDLILFESGELLRTGQPGAALTLLNQHQDTYGREREFLNNLAVAYLGNNEPEKALSLLRKLVDEDPMFSIIAHNLVEMELNKAGASAENVNPILFLQTVNSFLAGTPLPATPSSTTLKPQTPATEAQLLLENALRSIVQSWASAWSDKDIERYLGHYAASFAPNNDISRARWSSDRTERLEKPGEITVTISNIVIDSGSQRPFVHFDQVYQSTNYSDRTRKELVFTNDNGRWKILSETTIKKY